MPGAIPQSLTIDLRRRSKRQSSTTARRETPETNALKREANCLKRIVASRQVIREIAADRHVSAPNRKAPRSAEPRVQSGRG